MSWSDILAHVQAAHLEAEQAKILQEQAELETAVIL